MATEKKAAPLSDFVKFTKLGQSVSGKLIKFIPSNGKASEIIVLSPVLISSGDGTVQQWERAAVGLSTDLRQKITERDVDSFLLITFAGRVPTNKGSDRKIFTVMELELAEIRAAAEGADKTHRTEPYRDPERTHTGVDELDDVADTLPF